MDNFDSRSEVMVLCMVKTNLDEARPSIAISVHSDSKNHSVWVQNKPDQCGKSKPSVVHHIKNPIAGTTFHFDLNEFLSFIDNQSTLSHCVSRVISEVPAVIDHAQLADDIVRKLRSKIYDKVNGTTHVSATVELYIRVVSKYWPKDISEERSTEAFEDYESQLLDGRTSIPTSVPSMIAPYGQKFFLPDIYVYNADDKCSLCDISFWPREEVVDMPCCEQRFHFNCIFTLLKEDSKCPSCNDSLPACAYD